MFSSAGKVERSVGRSQVSQLINVFDPTWIAHVVAVRALGEFVAQVWQRDVRAIPLKQVNAVLTTPATFLAGQPKHMQLGRRLSKRVRTIRHYHNQLSVRNGRSI
jgi:hypothetical protein